MTGNEINLINFHADFEKAAHNAVLQIFPQCKMFDCTFIKEKIGSGKYNNIKYY